MLTAEKSTELDMAVPLLIESEVSTGHPVAHSPNNQESIMSFAVRKKTCVVLVRSNRNEKALNSQLDILRRFAQGKGLIIEDEIQIDGHTDSTDYRRKIDKLIHRKSSSNDFSYLLIQSWNRLSRSTTENQMNIVARVEAAGIQVMSADDSVNGPAGGCGDIAANVMMNAGFAVSHEASRRILAIRQRRIAEGSMPYSPHPQFGVDRLYLDVAGNKLFIIRNLPTRNQVQLNSKTHKVMRTFQPGHGYRKQPYERIVMLPGSSESVNIIRAIYKFRHVDKWSTYRIAEYLNKSQQWAAYGGRWRQDNVHQTLMNPTYLGLSVAHRRSTVHSLDPTLKSVIECRKQNTTIVYRRQSDWIVVEHPLLRNAFVPENLYEEIKRYQFQVMERNAEPEEVGNA